MSLASLNSSGIQSSNPALYQTINELINQNNALQKLIDSFNLIVNPTGLELGLSAPLTIDGGQIQFPAVQNPSADANTLDDYEEGIWTPTDVSGAGLTFANVGGTYTKIGRIVFLNGRVDWPATANGLAATIGGLPFTSAPATSSFTNYSMWPSFTTVAFFWSAPIAFSVTLFNLRALGGAAITNAQMSGSVNSFSGFYLTS